MPSSNTSELRPGLIVGYDIVSGGCACRWELIHQPASGPPGTWIAQCVASCRQHDFAIDYRYKLSAASIAHDVLSHALLEHFGA